MVEETVIKRVQANVKLDTEQVLKHLQSND